MTRPLKPTSASEPIAKRQIRLTANPAAANRITPRAAASTASFKPANPLWAPRRARPVLSKYEVSYTGANGDEISISRAAPASPIFEAAFMAFARGTLFATPQGPKAIEDLHPGMTITTHEGGAQRILWKGATTIVPYQPGQDMEADDFAAGSSGGLGQKTLTRLSTDAMGLQRPNQDLLLGSGGRVFCPGYVEGYSGAFVKAADLVDGENIFPITPPGPVRIFHIATERHCRLIANGIEVESFHPGVHNRLDLPSDMIGLYLSLFPHITRLADFGPIVAPRMTYQNEA